MLMSFVLLTVLVLIALCHLYFGGSPPFLNTNRVHTLIHICSKGHLKHVNEILCVFRMILFFFFLLAHNSTLFEKERVKKKTIVMNLCLVEGLIFILARIINKREKVRRECRYTEYNTKNWSPLYVGHFGYSYP